MRSKRERRDGMLEVCLEVCVDLYCAVANFNFFIAIDHRLPIERKAEA